MNDLTLYNKEMMSKYGHRGRKSDGDMKLSMILYTTLVFIMLFPFIFFYYLYYKIKDRKIIDGA